MRLPSAHPALPIQPLPQQKGMLTLQGTGTSWILVKTWTCVRWVNAEQPEEQECHNIDMEDRKGEISLPAGMQRG